MMCLFTITQAADVDFSSNPYADGKFKFNDQSLKDEIDVGNKVCTVQISGSRLFLCLCCFAS